MFGKHNSFVSKARVSACMYFLVFSYTANSKKVVLWKTLNSKPETRLNSKRAKLKRSTSFQLIISSWKLQLFVNELL